MMVVEARTCFGEIIRRAVEATPGAVGGAFADKHGELVDAFAHGYNALDWAILTAHYGVILTHVHLAFGVLHYGGPDYFIAHYGAMGIVVLTIDDDYYALLAVRDPGAQRGTEPWHDRAFGAVGALREAAHELRREMM
jgi:hypothetical protein